MKEYRALVNHRKFQNGKWCLAEPGKRFYKTKKEAENAIAKAIERGKPHWIIAFSNNEFVKEWYDSLEVIQFKIESREVTDWEIEE